MQAEKSRKKIDIYLSQIKQLLDILSVIISQIFYYVEFSIFILFTITSSNHLLLNKISNMKLIIISGPSGSGKTTLAKIILKRFEDGIILNTDNYYKTGLLSKILSKIVICYFDRKISFNYELFKTDIEFIIKNGCSNFSYVYNFKSKSIKKVYESNKNLKFIIVEGIFGKEIFKSFLTNKCILINLKTNKQSCMKRVIKRDYLERGKSESKAKRDFIKGWELFYKNKKKNNSTNYLKEITFKNKREINSLLNNLTKILN